MTLEPDPGTGPRLSIVTNHLHELMGDLAEPFVAMELFKIDRRYVAVEQGQDGPVVTIPDELPQVAQDDLDRLLEQVTDALGFIIGPQLTYRVVTGIRRELHV